MSQKYIIICLFMLALVGCGDNQSKPSKEPKFTNNLVNESSLYLKQHAHNPVHWEPWNDSLFNTAQDANKLLVISIGYASCHWCHVMERETFQDTLIAEYMNEKFINIKVDREERPDIDQLYMTAAQIMNGNSGWPLNVVALPNGKPLYAGTYHSKDEWEVVLKKMVSFYNQYPDKANEYANSIAAGVKQINAIIDIPKEQITLEDVKQAVDSWSEQWDLLYGGDKGGQKFMVPERISFLMKYAFLSDDQLANTHVKNSLDKMALGGVNDVVGGGFFRYSVDSQWKVPHFEKMLYDNAQLMSLYAQAYKNYQNELYKEVLEGLIEFTKNEMHDENGGYFASIDSNSEGREGGYYLWTKQELKEILNDDYELFESLYGIANEPFEGAYYNLYRSMSLEDYAKQNNLELANVKQRIEGCINKLAKIREERVKPVVDEKKITSWNALMINGFVDAYKALGDENLLNNAMNTAAFILNEGIDAKGELKHTLNDNVKSESGFLDDYAFTIDALIELYKVTLDEMYIDKASGLMDKVMKLFYEPDSGMFTFNQGTVVFSELVKTDDGVIPSPNTLMAKNFFQLYHIKGENAYESYYEKMLSNMKPSLIKHPANYAKWLNLSLNEAFPFYEIVIVGENAFSKVNKINNNYLPNSIVIGTKGPSTLSLFENRYVEGQTFIYVCQNKTCKLPVKEVEVALEQMSDF
ncbi:thioredoxin domain-containing protein [Zhouia amylolytica]|nr:thioredoxin domain-containing protein [Zhouia amylolytica]